jgi:glucose-1-phosphate cytidylyltransferase
MKVVILCGGRGTRLREETEFRPKPMVKIGGKPILWHIMKIYAHFGYNEFVLCLGYQGNIIKEYFLNYMVHNSDLTVKLGKNQPIKMHNMSTEEDWTITIVDTGEDHQKGARIKKIEPYIDSDTFMVTYGDGVGDINIKDLINFHNSKNKIATMTGVNPPSVFGQINAKGSKIIEFNEKPHIADTFINGGFIVFNRKIFDYLTEDKTCDLEHGALEQLAREEQLMVFRHEGDWACMDTYRDTVNLNQLWDNNQAFWKIWH